MIYLHLLGWALGVLALFGLFIGPRCPSVIPLWEQDLAHGLVKFLIPGEEILYWTRLQAVECNL
ncbi:hypothetical protein PCS_02584 [Desulfocurvibacter africanus PCS]|uniref:Uncharacterized protein n=1 Tax=Desulfocurvibacter africanus PCS TaxID=1262666 RepID=M5PQG3_DESAF|nr:hypothetical protein [Desulfocurvibacter africanus]EMG36572.1 hypothetical protein PCS_02584 [Desulfocurvibacter africanus PCS]